MAEIELGAEIEIRTALPADHSVLVRLVNDWWGHDVAPALPRLFLDHFHSTSFVAERDGAVVGFLVGFLSPAQSDEAYVHFIGVSPAERGSGLGHTLYDRFLDLVRTAGRSVVRAITPESNAASIAFHRAVGFAVSDPIPDYNRPGTPFVIFTRLL